VVMNIMIRYNNNEGAVEVNLIYVYYVEQCRLGTEFISLFLTTFYSFSNQTVPERVSWYCAVTMYVKRLAYT